MEMSLSKIVLLEAEVDRVCENIKNRDDKTYSKERINELIIKEHQQAIKISSDLSIPLIIQHMRFDKADIDTLIISIKGSNI